jgi:hypothetical protein
MEHYKLYSIEYVVWTLEAGMLIVSCGAVGMGMKDYLVAGGEIRLWICSCN